MRKNRDQLSIVVALLEVAKTGTSKTRIMYAANLSFKLLEKYLEMAVDVGLVSICGSSYRLTEQGRDFLKRYKHFHEQYVKVQRLLEVLDGEREQFARLCKRPGLVGAIKPMANAE